MTASVCLDAAVHRCSSKTLLAAAPFATDFRNTFMTTTNSRYVGFSTHEELLDAHEAGKPLFLAVPIERLPLDTTGLAVMHLRDRFRPR